MVNHKHCMYTCIIALYIKCFPFLPCSPMHTHKHTHNNKNHADLVCSFTQSNYDVVEGNAAVITVQLLGTPSSDVMKQVSCVDDTAGSQLLLHYSISPSFIHSLSLSFSLFLSLSLSFSLFLSLSLFSRHTQSLVTSLIPHQ